MDNTRCRWSVVVLALLVCSPSSESLRLLQSPEAPSSSPASSIGTVELPPLSAGGATSSAPSETPSPSPSPSSNTPDTAPVNPVGLQIPENQDVSETSPPAAVAGSNTDGSSYTSGKVEDNPAATPQATPSGASSPGRTLPTVRSPSLTPPQVGVDGVGIGQQQQQQDPSALTALISRDPSTKRGTFIPDGTSVSVTCFIPDLLATQPNLEISKGQSMLAAAIKGPLMGNFCPGDTNTPFAGCPPGYYCPTPGQQHQCIAGTYCPRGSSSPVPCPALAQCAAGSSFPAFNTAGLLLMVVLLVLYAAVYWGIKQFSGHQKRLRKPYEALQAQMWHLLNDQIRATEGFRFQGIQPIRDYMEITLNELSVAPPTKGSPMLKGVSGRIQHSRLTVTLAPRECDLSAFVSILSGRAPRGTALAGAVSVTVGDTSATLTQCRKLIGFASRETNLFDDLTVSENLEYACRRRLPSSFPNQQKHAVVEDVLRLLHLYEERGTMRLHKGDAHAKAGSLNWRLSMAMELVACPSLLVVDSVPNNLDPFQPALFLDCLNLLAGLGMTIVTTSLPGQAYARSAPNVDILLLSRDGLTVYSGPLRLTVPYFMSIGLGGLGRSCTEDTLLDIVSSPKASTPLLDGQTLADAWAERAMDPWTQKALRPAGDDAGGRLMEAAMEPMLHAHSAQGFDLEKLLPLAVAVLQFNAGSRGHKSAEEVTARTELSSADVLDLFAALGLPCSAAAAPAMLLSASSAWAAQPPADPPPETASAAPHARAAAAAGPTVTVVHFVTWLVQQAAVRRQRAQEHSAHSAARHGSLSSANTWPHSLPSLRIGPAPSWGTEAGEHVGGLSMELMPKQMFMSIDIKDDESNEAPDEAQDTEPRRSFAKRLLQSVSREGSLSKELELPKADDTQTKDGSSTARSSSDKRSSIELSRVPRVGSHSRKEPPAEGEDPVPLRERSWGNRSSSSVGGGGEDPTDPESGKHHPRRPQSLCKMLAACFKGRSSRRAEQTELVQKKYRHRRGPSCLHQLYLCTQGAALQWTRHMGSLTNSLVLAATVAFAVGLLCASSMDVSTTPAVLLRCVLAFALAAAPWSLPLFAAARTHLQRQHADWTYTIAFYVGAATVDFINIMLRPLIFGGVILWVLPIQGGFDWYCIVFFMVSWYVANAGYAAAAYLRPATAMAALLCAVLAVGLLLSGSIAPSARAMYRTARPLYDLSALSYSRWAMEMLTVVEYAGLDSSRQHLAMFQLAQMGYCGMDRPALAVRLDTRDDMAAYVAAALNPAALRATPFTDATAILAAATPELGSQLAEGLQCVLQNAAAKGADTGTNCIMQMCHESLSNDVRNLFLLTLSLALLTLLSLGGAFNAMFRVLKTAALALAQGCSQMRVKERFEGVPLLVNRPFRSSSEKTKT